LPTLIHERVESARAGTNPTVITRMASGWAVLGDVQFLRGYSLLLADPVVADINSLTEKQRQRFLLDMIILGDALLEVTAAFRINYEILGNSEAALHVHVFPRYMTEPDKYRQDPVWYYDREFRLANKFDIGRDKELMKEIAKSIQKRIK
jgi:diadenosine tetraphosphate (Ap4A) HIT family hydrolase